MKKTAFLQAIVLFILLILSWVLLVRRFKTTEEPPPQPAVEQVPAPQPETVERPAQPPTADVGPAVRIPTEWREWMDFLEAGNSGPDRMQRIRDLRQTLFALPPGEAVDSIMKLLRSGYDLPTGGLFASGEGGRLADAGSLREHLLDWLGQLDPATAAAYAMAELGSRGTAMPAGDYVLHLRNFAWGYPEEEPGRTAFLEQGFRALLNNRDWLANPGPAVAEAMDIAVYLGDSKLVAPLAALRAPGQSDVLQHAGDLALERLIEEDPLPAIRELLQSPEGRDLSPRARAGYVARLDPVDEAGRVFLHSYLADPGTSATEVADFLAYFPNLNRSLSYNLLSRENTDTPPVDSIGRLERALQAVESWQADPDLRQYRGILDSTRQRLLRQLNGDPEP